MITSDTMRKHLREGKLNASGRCEASRRWAAEETQSRKVKTYAWDLERQLSDLRAHADALADRLQSAVDRINDMLEGDDGQAWKEAEKALPIFQETLTAYRNREK